VGDTGEVSVYRVHEFKCVSKYGAWVRQNIFKGCAVTKTVEAH